MNKDFLDTFAAQNAGRKRKMKEVVENPLPPPPQFPTPPPLPSVPLNLFPLQSSSSEPLLSHFDTALRLNNAGHTPQPEQGGGSGGGGDLDLLSRPINSFTSLLNGDDGDTEDALSASLQLQKDFIEQAIKCYSDRVREMLEEMCMRQYAGVLSVAEERAAKKMKERDEEMGRVMARNAELERILASYRNQAMAVAHRLWTLEQINSSLRAALQEATLRGTRAVTPAGGASNQGGNGVPTQQVAEEEDAQSSSVYPKQVEAVRISCRMCGKRIATMMLWPCRHVSLCKRCKGSTCRCPVCQAIFQDSIEVYFSG